MGYYKLNADGTIQSANNKHGDDWLELSSLSKDSEDNYYEFYLATGLPDTVKIDATAASRTQEAINAESLAYLASTDWYVTRFTESGVAVPADVTTARAAARLAVVSA